MSIYFSPADAILYTINEQLTHVDSRYIAAASRDEAAISDLIECVTAEVGGGSIDTHTSLVNLATVVSTYTTRFPLATYIAGFLLIDSIRQHRTTFGLKTPLEVRIWGMERSRGIQLDFSTPSGQVVKSFLESINGYESRRVYNYLAASSMYHMYLWRDKNGHVFETPLDMYARIAVALCETPTPRALMNTFLQLEQGIMSVATPMLRNAGATDGQHASCFLQVPRADSVSGIGMSMHDVAMLSRGGGGVGIDLTSIRKKGIRHDGVMCAGTRYPLEMLNIIAKSVSQGARPGAVAAYMSIDHPEVMKLIEARNPASVDALRHIEIGLTIRDEFVHRLRNKQDWYFFCPNECPELRTVYGKEYSRVYNRLVEEGRYCGSMPTFQIMLAIARSLISCGMPYIIFIDHANNMSNQINLGLICLSNLCAEIVQVAKPDVITSCVLSAVNLSKCVENPFEPRHAIRPARLCVDVLDSAVRNIVRCLNKSYCDSRHPVPGMEDRSHPIGIGVLGLADMLAMLGVEFGSEEAQHFSALVARVMYCAAVQESALIAAERGKPYEGFEGSPLSRGQLHCDLYDQLAGGASSVRIPALNTMRISGDNTNIANIDVTRRMAVQGVANSLFIAFMPTRTTAEVMCVNDCFSPFQPLLHMRNAVAGTRTSVDHTLLEALTHRQSDVGRVMDYLVAHDGSIDGYPDLPEEFTKLFKTVWEVDVFKQIDMAAVRVPFIDQSQSLSYYMSKPDQKQLILALMHAHSRFLPTGIYYLRQRATVEAIRVPNRARAQVTEEEGAACSRDNPSCASCSL